MQIDFVVHIPGRRQKLMTMNMDDVPRQGESVVVDDETERTVHSVTYDLRTNCVRVILVV